MGCRFKLQVRDLTPASALQPVDQNKAGAAQPKPSQTQVASVAEEGAAAAAAGSNESDIQGTTRLLLLGIF
ncbi:unnamed protein product [Gongylonema pulchrum]|uniref:Uncharacterized protein n=1 Tax=Gongylonema pulchrum TaxID=637853 RepID=A0A183E2I0_9BILA|nr:unnamed protein product [Gongylonema pulchrum]